MKLLESTTVDLTPQLAQEFASMTPSPTEREPSAKRRRHLESEHSQGRFKTVHWVKAKHQGTTYRVNGQHSAEMLVGLNGTFPEGGKAHIDTYGVESMGELAELFRTFDSRQSSRSSLDVSGAYQGLLDELAHVDRRLAKMALAGIVWFSKVIDKQAMPAGDDLYDLYSTKKPNSEDFEYHPFILFFGQACSPRTKTQELQKAPVAAAMYGTFLKNEERARVFWPAVALNNAADDSDPAQLLSTQLVEVKENDEVRWTPNIFYAKCVKAWNAFMQDKQINSLNVNIKKGLPEILR